MKQHTLRTTLTILISLATLLGVALHDTKADKLAIGAIGLPLAAVMTAGAAQAMLANDMHNHVEITGMENVRKEAPRTTPRNNLKKYLLQKRVPRGGHAFDGYRLPFANY